MIVKVYCEKRKPMVFEWDDDWERYTHVTKAGVELHLSPWYASKGPWIGRIAFNARSATCERELRAIKALFPCGSVIHFPPLVKRKRKSSDI